MKRCEFCGEFYEQRDGESRKQWAVRKYCSRACGARAAKRSDPRTGRLQYDTDSRGRLPAACEVCATPLSIAHRRRTCSEECRNKLWRISRDARLQEMNGHLSGPNGRAITRASKSSSYRGVMHSAELDAWVAAIYHDATLDVLGPFLSESEAARAYDDAARSYFGELISPNITEG